MKKMIMAFSALILSVALMQGVEAKTVQVTALHDFNITNPPEIVHVQMNANTRLDYDLMLFQGFQVTGKIIPQQNGSFAFLPVSYVNYHEERLPMKKEYPALYKGESAVIRQNQPFMLVFPDNEPDTFQYYVPSSSDMN
ncbi:MAG: hypothetical protein E7Z87_02935 [Cyanobacteria bacterium SIG26]|nr:hypothetical protein [Cyanobacteria bacterium SIG26]